MSSPIAFLKLLHRASVMTGALFCVVLALAAVSCGEEQGTPDWGERGNAAAVEPAAAEDAKPRSVRPASGSGLRFMAYNVENWLEMERSAPGGGKTMAPKPESEKRAVIDLMVDQQPEVLGLAEIGTEADLADIQRRLKKRGLDLPYAHVASGADSVRRLGFLSRFPVVASAKPKVTTFQLRGRTYGINRGILDVTVARGPVNYRFVGVHFKSKREVEDLDQEQMRIHEAALLRRHVDGILKADPDTRLVVYGDFNDSRNSTAVRTVMGASGSRDALMPLRLRDSRGHTWTHRWDYEDIYSRLDYVAVSEALRLQVDFKASGVVDDRSWDEASDHRPLLVVFRSR